MNILLTFTILTIINVVFSTIKSIATVKSSPLTASVISAVYYGYYNLVLLYTVADFSIYWKVFITFACNFIGVYAVKKFEELSRKDKLWCIQTTIPEQFTEDFHADLKEAGIPHNWVDNLGKYSLFYIYSYTQKDTVKIKPLIKRYEGRYFIAEAKTSL